MGTKNNPGAFDCYEKAGPDGPMFVLLARDTNAWPLVDAWADMAEDYGAKPEKVAEARACADAMREWRRAHSPTHGLASVPKDK